MKVLLVGGGSGGHITPTLAVATELRRKLPKSELVYVVGKGDKLLGMVQEHPAIDAVHTVHSGKFRRYHGEGLKQLLDVPTMLKNLRDFFLVLLGFGESLVLLWREKPDVMLVKGGFVGVPVGLAAAILRVPYITHDSDAIPGLANRLIARWAKAHAVAMPKEVYNYPSDLTVQVGVPIAPAFKPVNAAGQAEFKRHLALDAKNPVLLVTGGGLGAQRLNEAVASIAKALLARHPMLHILHIAGPGKEVDLQKLYATKLGVKAVQVRVEAFVPDSYIYSGAADVIVARAGATTLAEFAAQGKACIVVPNQQLTGGHQLKNADVLARDKAIVVVPDEAVQKNPELLLQQVERLLDDQTLRHHLGAQLHKTVRFDAAEKLADLVISTAKTRSV